MASPQITLPLYLLHNQAQNNLSGGIKHLSPFSHLSVLGLTDCKLGDDDVPDLVALPWDNLESIWISYNKIGVKGIECFIGHKWPKLISLHISTINILSRWKSSA